MELLQTALLLLAARGLAGVTCAPRDHVEVGHGVEDEQHGHGRDGQKVEEAEKQIPDFLKNGEFQRFRFRERERELRTLLPAVVITNKLVSWCFEPSQPVRITSGLLLPTRIEISSSSLVLHYALVLYTDIRKNHY